MDFIANMTIGELLSAGTLAALGLSTVVQIAPIKINPWSTLAGWVGRAINGEVIREMAELKNDILEVKQDIQGVKDTDAERDAKQARARILQFGDELIHDVRHSKEHFDDVLQDMDDYEHYCKDHPEFKNNRTHATTQHILDVYHKCMEDHSFL